MGILIKDMKMPKNCRECQLLYVTSICDGSKDCPLVPVPPHGDLIDRDALEQDAQKRLLMCNKYDNQFQKPYEVIRAIALAPTVIPAEGKCDIAFQSGAGCSDCDDYWECNQRLEKFFRAEQAEEETCTKDL